MSIERTQVVDFSRFLVDASFTVLMKNPLMDSKNTTNFDLWSFLKVFTSKSWLGIVFAGVLIGFILCSLILVHSPKKSVIGHVWIFVYGFKLYAMSLIMKADWEGLSRFWALKLFNFMVSICGLFLYIAYTSDWTARITSGSSREFSRSFMDLHDNGYKIYVLRL